MLRLASAGRLSTRAGTRTLAALAEEDKAALSGCPRQAIAGQYAGVRQRGSSVQPSAHEVPAAIPQARKIAPMRLPINALAPSSVIAKSAIAQTPSALAIPGPSPKRSNNA